MELTIDEALKKGVEAHKLQQIQEADKFYTAILQVQPKHPDANHNMGVLAVGVGKVQEALPFFKAALEAKSSIAQYWLSYIDALIKLDRIVDAKYVLDQAKVKGAKGKAFDELKQRLNAPNKVSIDPPQNQLNTLINLYQQGQLQQALDSTKQLLKQFPNSFTLYNIQGASNAGLGQFNAAIDSYKQALKIKPDYAEVYSNMGAALNDKGDLDAAIDSCKKALKIKPNYAEAYFNMGNALRDKGDLDAAVDSYKQALKIKPDYVKAYYQMSITLNNRGGPDPGNDIKEHDDHFVKMQTLYLGSNITDEQRSYLSFALSKACEELNEISQSFTYLKIGNELRKKILSYNIKQDIELFRQLKQAYPSIAKVALQSAGGANGLQPIFILGMPRSGTTLVEQIISSHSQVTGAGELSYVHGYGQSIAKGVIKPNAEVISDFRQRYIEALKNRSDNRSIVTDKMPQNFRYVGLIFSAFPDAKVIHVNRSPAATCWSNYKHYFITKGLEYSYDLDDLVVYFRLYQDLMRFWQGHYGDRIYNVNYGKLAINQEDETKRLIQYLGLEWEDDCLSPQNNKRNVRTASGQQVRQKVYQGSSLQWRKFEPYLDGVFDKLESKVAL
jgi:tetratricopeptide (TPR) repeat protein